LSWDRVKVKVAATGCTWDGGGGFGGWEKGFQGEEAGWRMGETGAKESRKHSWGEGLSRQVSKVKVAPGGICCGVTVISESAAFHFSNRFREIAVFVNM